MQSLEYKLNYHFKNRKYLQNALTHSSYANERRGHIKSNERLEFLGDSVLGLIVSDYIYRNCPNFPEGDLTKLRSSLVCEQTLCRFSRSLGVGDYLLLSKGEHHSKGNERPSILADAFEAIIAAIYLDGGMPAAKDFVLSFVVPEIQNPKPKLFKDYKTFLQEIVQKNREESLRYVLVSETGPDHDKHFVMEVHLNNNVLGKGGGKSKKEAEQNAAKQALEMMGY